MEQPVENGRGHHLVPEHVAPGPDGLVAGEHQAAFLVTAAHQVEQQMPGLALQGEIAQLIHDQQVGPSEMGQGLLQRPALGRFDELVDQIRGMDESTAPAQFYSPSSQANRQVGLSDTGRPEQKDIRGIGQIPPCLQLRDHPAIQAGLEAEVVVLQAAVQGKLRHLEPHPSAFDVLAGDLLLDDVIQKIQKAHFPPGPALQKAVQALPRTQQLQAGEVAFQALHARIYHGSPPTAAA